MRGVELLSSPQVVEGLDCSIFSEVAVRVVLWSQLVV
jgi:hypothetical protein